MTLYSDRGGCRWASFWQRPSIMTADVTMETSWMKRYHQNIEPYETLYASTHVHKVQARQNYIPVKHKHSYNFHHRAARHSDLCANNESRSTKCDFIWKTCTYFTSQINKINNKYIVWKLPQFTCIKNHSLRYSKCTASRTYKSLTDIGFKMHANALTCMEYILCNVTYTQTYIKTRARNAKRMQQSSDSNR